MSDELRAKIESEIDTMDALSEHDPFSEMSPEGNDYRTGYKDGLRWCAARLRKLLEGK